MRTIPLRDILTGTVNEVPRHYLYSIRGDNTWLYVGKSNHPARRVREHVGTKNRLASDTIGQAVLCNLPRSLFWRVYFYTLTDCLPALIEMWSKYTQRLTQLIENYRRLGTLDITKLHKKESETRFRLQGAIGEAENALIVQQRPCVNVIYNSNIATPFPKTLRKPASFTKLYPTVAAARLCLAAMLEKTTKGGDDDAA
jgi:predicted GIY-YIG superfamily endonuclease